jgi:DNA polymerase I-like protein with 3'-5' exonuclease and polymerase domains
MASTLSGRVRYLDPEKTRNEFYNTPVQGSGADGLKASLALVYRRMKAYGARARMVHMVHDEILVEVDDDPELTELVRKDLGEAMVEGMRPLVRNVPIEAEGSIGDSWADKA